MGLKDLAKPSPFYIRPKAHVEEEEMFEDEQRESRLPGYTAESSSADQNHRRGKRHVARGNPLEHPK